MFDLEHPAPLFKLFLPTPEKVLDLRRHLLNDYLYMHDWARNEQTATQIILEMFRQPNAIYYEIGDWAGVAGFRNITPGWAAHATFKFWGKELWGKEIVRQMRSVLAGFEETYKLVRIESETADPRIEKLTRMVGFEREGVKRKGYLFDGKYYDLIILGRVKEMGREG